MDLFVVDCQWSGDWSGWLRFVLCEIGGRGALVGKANVFW